MSTRIAPRRQPVTTSAITLALIVVASMTHVALASQPYREIVHVAGRGDCDQRLRELAVAGGVVAITGGYNRCLEEPPSGLVYVFDPADGRLLRQLPGRSAIGHGDHLVVSDALRTVEIVDPLTGDVRRGYGSVSGAFPDASLTVRAVAGDDLVAVEVNRSYDGGHRRAVSVFDGATGALRFSHPFDEPLLAVAASSELVVATVGALDSRIDAWDAETGALRWSRTAPAGAANAHFGRALAMLDGDVVVGAPRGAGIVHVLDGETGEVTRTLEYPPAAYPGNQFGWSLAAGNGLILVGDPYADDANQYGRGNVYGFEASSGRLVLPGLAVPNQDNFLGDEIALLGDRIVTLGLDYDEHHLRVFAPRCGDGVLDECEPCDDGNTADGDGCAHDCLSERCGDGTLDDGEICDDGNTVDGDGCDANCRPTGCGNCRTDPTEDCDDGNLDPCDACDPNCTTARCGNGIFVSSSTCDVGSERCDDGNVTSGDGCSDRCLVERGATSTSLPVTTSTSTTSSTTTSTSTSTSSTTTSVTSTTLPPACANGPCTCDDDDPCTLDSSTPAGCRHTPVTGTAAAACGAWPPACGRTPAWIADRLAHATGDLLAAETAASPGARRRALRAARRALADATRAGRRGLRSERIDESCARALVRNAKVVRREIWTSRRGNPTRDP